MQFRRTTVNGIEIAYTVQGEGPPLILIHGLACGQRMWLHQVRQLRNAFTVITYDQRGHGRSGAPHSAAGYSSAHLTHDLVGLMDHLDMLRCHLVGFSLGGGPALAVASLMPERVASLVLADVGAGAENSILMSSATRSWTTVAQREGMSAVADEMLRAEFFKTYANVSARARCHMRALIMSTPLHGLVFTLSEVLSKRRSLFRMAAVMRSVRVPTLVLRGDLDNVCRAASKLLADTIPQARRAVLSGAGHMAPLEAPNEFNQVLSAFLNEHPTQ